MLTRRKSAQDEEKAERPAQGPFERSTDFAEPSRPSARLHHWYDQFGPSLFRFCLWLSGGRKEVADDLVQTTFLQAVQAASEFNGPDDAARSWLFRSAKNHFLNRKRTESRWVLPLELEELLSEDETGTELEKAQAEAERICKRRHLIECMKKLDPLARDILQLRYGLRPEPGEDQEMPQLEYSAIVELLSAEYEQAFTVDYLRIKQSRSLPELRRCMRYRAMFKAGGADL